MKQAFLTWTAMVLSGIAGAQSNPASPPPPPASPIGIAAAPPKEGAAAVDPAPAPAPPGELPFSWGNKLPSFVKRGADLYMGGDYKSAEHDFESARLLDPGVAAPAFNLGLTAARQDRPEDAVAFFDSAADLAREDAQLRAKALYNKGVVRFEQAREALEKKQDKQAAILGAIEALDAFRGAELASKDLAEAPYNRALVQDFLRKLPVEPPQQQNQQQDDQEQDEQKQQNQQQQNQQQNSGSQSPEQQSEQQQQSPQDQQDQNQEQPQDGQQQEQKQQPDQQQQGQPRQDKPEPSEQQEGQQQDVQPQGQGDKDKQDGEQQGRMTPEEARQLLNMLEDGEKIRLTKGRNPKANPKGKPW